MDKLSKVDGLDQEAEVWAERLRVWLDEADPELEDAARLFITLKDKLETLKAASTHVQKIFDMVRLNYIPDKMDDRGITNITFDGICRLGLTSDIRASILKMHRTQAYEWMEENGYGDLIQESINPSTLKAFCKRRIKEGEELPEDLFTVSPFSRASVTKVR
jgi:hypothetical protein